MEQYNVTGMSCAACSTRVEKAVSKVPGVTSCSVSLLTNSMGIEGTASPESIIKAVEDAGYGASKKGAAQNSTSPNIAAEDALKDRETPILNRYHVPLPNQKYMMPFYINGIMGIVNEWLKENCEDSIEHMISVIQVCIPGHQFEESQR